MLNVVVHEVTTGVQRVHQLHIYIYIYTQPAKKFHAAVDV